MKLKTIASHRGTEPLLFFAVFYLPGYIRQSTGFRTELFLTPFFHIQYLIIAVPQLLLMLYVLSVTRTNMCRRYGLVPTAPEGQYGAGAIKTGIFKTRPARMFLPVLSTYLGVMIVAGAAAALASLLGAAPSLGEAPSTGAGAIPASGTSLSLSSPLAYILILLTCTVIGYHEELFFRSYLLTEFGDMQPMLVALAGSLLFASGHLYQGVAGYLGTFAIGLFLSYRFLRHRSLHEVAIAHTLYNFTAILVLLHYSRATTG